jgi:LuxR family maltose regulon positive regulatory protein
VLSVYNQPMSAPILTNKLFIPPPRPKAVRRLDLIERLNEGLSANRKLTLISAPAGFGKTTLVSEWIATCQRPVAWLSLDAGDNDPACFLTYLVAALQTVAPKIGEGALGALQSPQPPPIESILTSLLNEITNIPENFVLVLDDYHLIEAQPVDSDLTFLLEHLPPQMHLVIATREDPYLPLARLRARGQLTELRAADLRFTPSEAAEFLNRVMGLNLSAENIAALEIRTEGWIAGLQLAALSLQGREDIASFIQAFTGSHRFVLDYLGEEVLQHQPENIRSFLLQTAILERLCAPLCNAVTEREDGKEMLDILERSNLFLIPLDEKRQWYRYHHLFTDVLQTHLMEAQTDWVASLHGRASAWYERNGLRSDAILHALAAKDFETAACLIELAWPAAEEGRIQITTWLGWVKTLPDELVFTRPVLNVWYAYALLGRGDIEAADVRFKTAEQLLEPSDTIQVQPETPSIEMVVVDQEQLKSLPAAIAVGRAYIAQALGNVPDTVRYASRVLELVPQGDHLRHGQASMLLGLTCWASGDLEAADRVFADYTLKLRTAGNIPDAISTIVVLADIRLTLGHLHEAINTIDRLLKLLTEQGEPICPDTADLHRALSELHLEQGNLEVAAQHLQRSQELGEKADLPVWRYRWCIDRARLNETLGDLDGALAILDKAERLHIRSPLPDVRPISALKARIWVKQSRLAEALDWVRQQGLSPDDDISYLHEFEHITLARVLVARYKNDPVHSSIHAAISLLDRLLQAAEEGNRMGSMIEILLMQALSYQAQGNIPTALVSLERALTLAEPEGYVRVFVDESKPMAELLTRIQPKDGTLRLKEYILKLLSAFDMYKTIDPSDSTLRSTPVGEIMSPLFTHQVVSPQPLIEPLSKREMEVLSLLRSDLSGPEIARECMVSLSTLRTHTQNIYTKLGVSNRRAAVRRAEELDLL